VHTPILDEGKPGANEGSVFDGIRRMVAADRQWTMSIADHGSSCASGDGQACVAAFLCELIGLLSSVRGDYGAVVVFDRPL